MKSWLLRGAGQFLFAAITVFGLTFGASSATAQETPVVGLIPRAQHPITIDGNLDDWSGAFITPLNATNPDFANRATDVYYLWDEQALYIGLNAMDRNPTQIAGDNALYDGDAVEFYLDTRSGADLGAKEFGPGTLHMFFTALTGHDLKPRYHLRDLPAFKDLTLKGVEMAAARTPAGYTLEFKLPWANFPAFKPGAGTPIGIDVEMGSSDGGHRIHRAFAYSSPTSVGTPSTFGRVTLVDRVDPLAVQPYSRALFPFDAQVPGNYGWIFGVGFLSPTIASSVDSVDAALMDAAGKVVKTAQNTRLQKVRLPGERWRGEWETYDLPTGNYTLVLTARDAQKRAIVERTLPVYLRAGDQN
ncbi:MAG TPA: sugar-binding protein [Armatimonadota bacterium]|nr:sugar-binding protein [Armatimonadota bacterium]